MILHKRRPKLLLRRESQNYPRKRRPKIVLHDRKPKAKS
jgi:hypothetical protein